jgi:hypothetical protein
MKAAWLRPAFLAPVLGYVELRMLASPVPWGPWVVVAALATASPLLLGFPAPSRWLRSRTFGAIAAIAALVATALVAGADLAIGLLLGAPLAVLGWAIWNRASLPVSLFNIPLAGAVGLLEISIAGALPSVGAAGRLPAGAWLTAVHSVLSHQAQAVGLGPVTGSVAPLSYTGDSIFDALTLLSLLGTLLSMLALSERAVGLPDSPGDRARRNRRRRTGALGTNGWRASMPAPPVASVIPPSAYLLSGITALVATLGTLVAFELAGFLSYGSAMIGMAAGVLVVVAALGTVGSASSASRAVLLDRRPTPSGSTPRSRFSQPRMRRGRPDVPRARPYAGAE